MKIFDQVFPWKDKVNFVDQNNVFLGYDMCGNCCETFYWFIADYLIADFGVLSSDSYVKDASDTDYTEWYFDTKWCMDAKFSLSDGDGSGCVVFKITNGVNVKYVYLVNHQNGYYSHGFEFVTGEMDRYAGDI